MRNIKNIFTILLFILGINLCFAQENKDSQINEDECYLLFGNHNVPFQGDTWIVLPKEELLKIDSVKLSKSCQSEISWFYFMYNTSSNLEYTTNSNGSHFPDHYYYFRNDRNEGSSFYIKAIVLEKGGKEVVRTFVLNVTVDSALAFVFKYPDLELCYKDKNNMSKAMFIKNSKIRVEEDLRDINEKGEAYKSSYTVSSYDIKIVSKDDSKLFHIKGENISQEVKKYITQTDGEINIHVRNVIAKNTDGDIKYLAGIDIQCEK